jgi:Protein of unknown function (DUF3631)
VAEESASTVRLQAVSSERNRRLICFVTFALGRLARSSLVSETPYLRGIEPAMPETLNAAGDRAPDAWEPLVAIADVAGGVWPQRARNAALALTGVDMAALADSDVDIELLSDIAQILNACDTLAPTAEQLKNNKHLAVEALETVRRSDGQAGGNRPPRRVVGLGGERLTNALASAGDPPALPGWQ